MQEILSFIAQRRSIGQQDQEIQSELLAAGWDPQLVAQSFQQSPPASHPFETVAPPAMPNDSFAPQPGFAQPMMQQPMPQPLQPQPQQMPQGFPPANYGNIPNPMQLPQVPPLPMRQRSGLPLIIGIGVVFILLVAVAWFVLLRPSSSASTTPTTSTTSQNGGLTDQATITEITDRDAQRRADVDRLLTEANAFRDLNQGRFPEANREGWQTLIGNFRDFNDPLTEKEYEFTTATPEVGQMQYSNRVICNDDRLAVGTERSIVIRVLLESGAIYCVDNTQ